MADIPDLEDCSAFGIIPEDALAVVQRAKAALIEVARTTGKPIPSPTYCPAICQTI